MNFREMRDPKTSFPVGSKMQILPANPKDRGIIIAKVLRREGDMVIAKDTRGRLHTHHYKCARIWCRHA